VILTLSNNAPLYQPKLSKWVLINSDCMNEANEVGACWVDGLAGAEKVEAVWRPAHEVAESTAEAVGQVVQSASVGCEGACTAGLDNCP
jgi:hypothetical protein